MSSIIKIGVVGCGSIIRGHFHGFKALREHGFENFRITALCDRKIEYAQSYRKRGEGPAQALPKGLPWNESAVYISDIHDDVLPDVYADWREMLRSAEMDAVLIAAPIFLHHQVAIDSLRAGKHVLCEKPLAVSVKAGHRMVAEAQARGLSLAVAENVHYSPGLRIQKFLLDSGLIGRVQMWLSATMGAWLLSSMDAVFDDTPWRHRKLLSGGGFALDAGVHAFNQIRYLCGKIDQISAMAPCLEPRRYMRDADGQVIESVDSEVGDAYFAHLRFASGAVGAIMAGRAGHGEPTGLKDGTTIYGTKGCIKGGEVILDDGQRISGKTHFKDVAPVELKQSWFPRGLQDIFALEQLDFLQSVESAKEMETDGQEGLSDLACSFAVLESAALNQPVSVADVLSGSVDTYQQEVNKHYGL